MKRILLTILIVSLCALGASAQGGGSKKKSVNTNTFSVGVGGGARCNFMKITHISPDNDADPFPVWRVSASVFGCWEFLDGRFGVRPQVAFLKRGAHYNCILPATKFDSNLGYEVGALYVDVRMPFVCNIKSKYSRSALVPFVYATPIFGFATGGNIVLDGSGVGAETCRIYTKVPVSDANIAKHYFGVGAGVGVNCKLEIGRNEFQVGLEMMYDYGLTNTYSQSEKDGKVNDVGQLVDYTHYRLNGKRTFHGLEMQLTLSVPVSLDFQRQEKPRITRSVRNL